MENVLDFFRAVNALVPAYPRYIFWGVLVGVVLLTQIVKQPIKLVTQKIPNDTLRQKANTVILFVPIGLGMLASWLLTFLEYEFLFEAGLVWGTVSQVVYEFFAKLFKRVKNGEDITDDTLKNDLQSAKDKSQTAVDEFNALVNKVTKGKK